jgi:hypothetical protein
MKHQDTIARKHWQAFSEEEIFSELKTSEKGLNQEEVKKRLEFTAGINCPRVRKSP